MGAAKHFVAAVWTVALLVSAAAIAQPASPRIDLVAPAVTAADAVKSVARALKAGDPADAEKMASLALDRRDLDPAQRLRVLLNRGVARERQGKRKLALADFTAALAAKSLDNQTRARALFDRGIVRDEMGRLDAAIADYSAALKLIPAFPAALNNRANALRRLGRLSEARRDYQASLAGGNAMPQYSDYGLGQIAEIEDRFPEAERYYRKALEADPGYKLARQGLAALAKRHSKDTAVAWQPVPATATSQGGATRVRHQNALPLRPAINGRAGTAVASLGSGGAAQPPRAPERVTSGHGGLVQLAAYRIEADAAAGWNHMVDKAGGLLSGLTPKIMSVDLPGRGRFYRLRAGPVANARALCRRLKARGLACFPVKH